MHLKESETVELKRSTAELKEAVISVAAILNKHGAGTLYFGVKNEGTAVGQDISEKTLREIAQAFADNLEPKIYPAVEVEKIDGKRCIKVPFAGNDMPYLAYGRGYMRVADADKQLSMKALENIFVRKNSDRLRWEIHAAQVPVAGLSTGMMKSFIKKANGAGRISFKFDNVRNVLKKLDLLHGKKLLNAAQALFCPRNLLEVQFAVFAGTDKLTFLDIQQAKGCVFDLLDKSERYVREHINWRVKFGGMAREEVPEIPVKAVREALVNSFCHRDYRAPESNKIAVFKDRVEIYNPGAFPEGRKPFDYIRHHEASVLRNPLIADVLYKSGEIEKWGSGLKRIYEECRAAGVKVEFRPHIDGFAIVFYRPKGFEAGAGTGLGVKLGVKLGVNEQRVLDLVRVDNSVTIVGIAGQLGISTTAVENNLARMKKKGVLRRVGSDKAGRWEALLK